ncbi:hypothetical protein EK21DRAFT_86249 [Setomelanomma holmii]|uniref:Secreted protein n=1 Tax=Setomelanomma holmii TaxID=210430 RepID=A0A9P4HFB4_9PLEO|nr:hypothetical protein EK21DRAFT_86249 [Setomelanomma holmii]
MVHTNWVGFLLHFQVFSCSVLAQLRWCSRIGQDARMFRPPVQSMSNGEIPASDISNAASFVPMHPHHHYQEACCTLSRYATFISAAKPPRCTPGISNHSGVFSE